MLWDLGVPLGPSAAGMARPNAWLTLLLRQSNPDVGQGLGPLAVGTTTRRHRVTHPTADTRPPPHDAAASHMVQLQMLAHSTPAHGSGCGVRHDDGLLVWLTLWVPLVLTEPTAASVTQHANDLTNARHDRSTSKRIWPSG